MLSLSPAKLLVILVIALIVLGPEKLPQVARQIGAAWHDLRGWRSRIESEVRGTFPNLPPTHEVAQAVRSPLAFLDRLADAHERALTEQSDEPDDVEALDTEDDDAEVGPGPPFGDDSSISHGSALSDEAVSPQDGASPHGAGLTSPGSHNGSVGVNGSGAHSSGANGSGANGSGANGAGDGAGAGAPVVPSGFPAVPDDPSMN